MASKNTSTISLQNATEDELLAMINHERLPKHVAFIMDGNGRWATQRGLPRVAGHVQGRETVRRTLRACLDLGIPVVTLYTFSSENWTRPQEEVDALMVLIEETARAEIDELHENGVRLQVLGRMAELPDPLRNELNREMEMTKNNSSLVLNLAINYGGRAELVDAAKGVAAAVKRGDIDPADIDDKLFSSFLYTHNLPDTDLLIRTAGELRVSNFLLWQIAYAEIWVTPVLWPDFGRRELYQALVEYQRRVRKFGGVQG